jgi:hypothetical protein
MYSTPTTSICSPLVRFRIRRDIIYLLTWLPHKKSLRRVVLVWRDPAMYFAPSVPIPFARWTEGNKNLAYIICESI